MKAELKVTLIEKPGNADGLAGLAASICTANGNACKSLEHALDSNHLSVTEHANFTFYVDGVSRALLAQLTRHRIASFSVQSQRYVSMNGFDFIIPPEKRGGVDLTSRNMKYKLSLGPRAAREKDAMIMSMDTLDALVLSAHEGKCKICMKPTCAGCPLCKALDNVIAHDRDGRSWGAINICEVM